VAYSTDTILSVLKGLILSVLGGTVCSLLRVPLPWMLGPLFAMAFARMRDMPVSSLQGSRQAGQLVIGCALGQYFTPEVGYYVASHSLLIAGAAFGTLVLGSMSGFVLSRTTGTDPVTSFFSSLPGGASEMVVLADRFGARLDKVALAHSLRVPMVVSIIPFLMFWSGASGTDSYQPVMRAFELHGFLLLLSGATACGLALQKIRMPNAWMFGPLFLSISLTLFDYRTSAMPSFVVNAGQLFIGCSLGARFLPSFIREAPRFAAGVLLSVVASLCLSACMGVIISFLGNIPLASAVLGTAPGGLAEMCITAKVLKLGVPLVTALHITRLLLIMTLSAPAVYVALRYSDRLRSAVKRRQ